MEPIHRRKGSSGSPTGRRRGTLGKGPEKCSGRTATTLDRPSGDGIQRFGHRHRGVEAGRDGEPPSGDRPERPDEVPAGTGPSQVTPEPTGTGGTGGGIGTEVPGRPGPSTAVGRRGARWTRVPPGTGGRAGSGNEGRRTIRARVRVPPFGEVPRVQTVRRGDLAGGRGTTERLRGVDRFAGRLLGAVSAFSRVPRPSIRRPAGAREVPRGPARARSDLTRRQPSGPPGRSPRPPVPLRPAVVDRPGWPRRGRWARR